MRLKSILLILLFSLSALPMPTVEAQFVPAVELECIGVTGSGEVPIDVYPGATRTGVAYCTVSNPTVYQEKIDIEVQADGLAVAAPGSVNVAAGGEEEFLVTVRADPEMRAQTRQMTVTATVVEMNGVPPPNIATADSELLIQILQFSGVSVELTEAIIAAESGSDFNIEFKVYNQGNAYDTFLYSVDGLEEHDSAWGLPLSQSQIEAKSAPENVRVQINSPKDISDAPINDLGLHELTITFEFTATSDFSCKQESSGCNSFTVLQTITLYQEAGGTDAILSGNANSSQMLIYGGGAGLIILLLVLSIVFFKRKKN